ncbi:hypothetical protein [Polyangium mundeleinium]|uniref:Uncharacterized protein n=1 Tax=Polyangium mundeleinium TaxID=2995306 RepID=A0ABT5EHR9_9BACT|nr:hypothetical protein [Polyangium mundeleinium]MDC0740894.1 hypothetical protein [Polyangium mundeleinium]
MTLLMVWTNKPNDPTAINIASDSLLSADDGKGGQISWQYATKIHRLHPTREYFGYCGDSFVALSAIASAVATISNSDHLHKVDEKEAPTVDARAMAIHEHLRHTFPLIPTAWRRPATLLLAGWDSRKECFSVWRLELSDKDVAAPVAIDLTSKRVHCFGSGAASAKSRLSELEKKGVVNTQGIVKALHDVILDGKETSVGGAPQMVMLTKESDVPVGFWWSSDGGKGTRHLFGLPIHLSSKMENVSWREPATFDERPFVPFKRVDA